MNFQNLYSTLIAGSNQNYLLRLAVITSVLAFLMLGQYPHGFTEPVQADTQLSKRPRDVRVAHLGSDAVAGRLDFIFREKTTGAGTTITAYAPGGTLLFSIPPDATQPIDELIDVVDMDGDGSAEIIAISGGNGAGVAPVLYIYDGYGNQRTRFQFVQGTTLNSGGIKIYSVGSGLQVVAAPDTSNATSGFVYFFGTNGSLIASPSVPGSGGGAPEYLSFPGVVVGDVNNSGRNTVFVIAKSRLLAFNDNGVKLYYKQFVDPFNGFIGYNTSLDKPSGTTRFWGGRRYGMQQLIDVNGDGDLELVLAADKNNIDTTHAGGVYEAYNVTDTSQVDGYISHLWQTWIMNSSFDAPVTINNPQTYPIGVSIDGITDVNGDGIPDIVVTENVSGNPVVRVINARTGAVTGTVINGICLDVRVFDASQSLPDLVIYDTTTPHPSIPGLGTHMIWRFNQGTYTPVRLTESPANTFAAGAATMLREKYSLSTSLTVGVNTGDGHYSVEPGRSSGVWSYTAYGSLSCPSALYSWTTTGGVIHRSLDVSNRPGEVVDILKYDSASNRLWVLNLETNCVATNIVRTATQSGSSLTEYPGSCNPQLAATSPQSYPATPPSPGTGTISITVSSGCTWTAASSASWITFPSGNSGTGNGALTYAVAQNISGSIRSGTITVSGQSGSQFLTVFQGAEFADVPTSNTFYSEIGRLAAHGVTVGCSTNPLNYCPNDSVPHEQMAAFVMRAKGETVPPTPLSQRFADVPPSSAFYPFIDRMDVLNIWNGCGTVNGQRLYCPGDPVYREQMAAIMIRGIGEYSPPTPPTQRFSDVLPSNQYYNFIDRMAVLQITLGCTPDHLMYCPNGPVTRAEMAAFLVRAFKL